MANNRNTKNLLVIDWSNIMFRSLFMHKLFGGSASYDRIEDMRSFIHKFAVDVCAIVNMFKPNKVIIATDGKNAWRKDVYADYKSGSSCRSQDEPQGR
jgi:5'-3' exonuclease